MALGIGPKVLLPHTFGQQQVEDEEQQNRKEGEGEVDRVNAQWSLWTVTHDASSENR